ncbi:hypothetical protein [Planktothrix sp. FACHB-1365]|uniref:hypothetical protein n=1 Tax=Planktothrix sp. FACHB-1365 TaxID=2692855 RepID=UPI001688FDEE|nr:hypothetical protein [Planktothrix sp. FACHB-1365]MBD2485875.1 hypothetical protein [Planktothrix sp. FACHB-1365]
MIYMFNVSKDDGFCTVIGEIINIYSIKILELIECDDINLWCQTVRKLHQNYNVRYHYYLGTDDYFSILKSISPEYKKLIYRKEWEELNLEKLLKKLTNNKIELPLEWEHLRECIFDKDIKTDTLKLIACLSCFYVEFKPYSDGVFIHYNPVQENDIIKSFSPFGDVSVESVKKLFE